ncbi:MAG: thioredoxin domain-containing protein [Longimicrobiales bacterium]|nr:thioredoxin domain-containing protein [Longimicrobiales bacterium]
MEPANRNQFWVAILVMGVLANLCATLFLSVRVKEIREVAVWFTLPQAATLTAAVASAEPSPPIARPEVRLYFDPSCEVCRTSTNSLLEVYDAFEGKLEWNLVPVGLPEYVDPRRHLGGLSLVCAVEAGAGFAYIRASGGLPEWTEGSAWEAADLAGLDVAEFRECVRGEDAKNILWNNVFDARRRGVPGTPTLVWGQISISGELTRPALEELIREATMDGFGT